MGSNLQTEKKRRHGRKNGLQVFQMALALWCGLFVSAAGDALAAQTPTLRLFPTTVVENIKATGETAQAMETNLQAVMHDLDKQMQLYTQSGCQGAEADQGCAEIARQMTATYKRMLDQMAEQLPKMESSVLATNDSLGKKLRQELGKGMTPRQLQKLLQGSSVQKDIPAQTKAGKLSDKFRKYYELVRLGPAGSRGSLVGVASEIFLDSKEVVDLISLTRDEIGRARLMIELNQFYGQITPEMFQMVAGVKQVIFGETEEIASVPGPVASEKTGKFVSPLEK